MIYDFIDGRIRTICQKDRTSLCIASIHMMNTIGFFFSPSVLMTTNDTIGIVINGTTCNETCLGPLIHSLFIDIITLLGVCDKNSLLDTFLKQFICFLINTGIIGMNGILELCFRTVDCQKGKRILRNDITGFFSIVYVIRK